MTVLSKRTHIIHGLQDQSACTKNLAYFLLTNSTIKMSDQERQKLTCIFFENCIRSKDTAILHKIVSLIKLVKPKRFLYISLLFPVFEVKTTDIRGRFEKLQRHELQQETEDRGRQLHWKIRFLLAESPTLLQRNHSTRVRNNLRIPRNRG